MIPLDTDHSGLNKFSGKDDENFKLVLPEIRRMVENGPSIVTERHRARGKWIELYIETHKLNILLQTSALRAMEMCTGWCPGL